MRSDGRPATVAAAAVTTTASEYRRPATAQPRLPDVDRRERADAEERGVGE